MNLLSVDLAVSTGAVKPLHCVNNGPVHSFNTDQRVSNLQSYRGTGIPYARTHDAAFFATYGGEHTVDISAVFPNFDADAYSPASYDFVVTDEYLRVIQLAGRRMVPVDPDGEIDQRRCVYCGNDVSLSGRAAGYADVL